MIKHILTRIEEDKYKKIKKAAIDLSLSMNELMIQAALFYIKEKESKGDK